eukprot:3290361-Rhodomonas_salina.1
MSVPGRSQIAESVPARHSPYSLPPPHPRTPQSSLSTCSRPLCQYWAAHSTIPYVGTGHPVVVLISSVSTGHRIAGYPTPVPGYAYQDTPRRYRTLRSGCVAPYPRPVPDLTQQAQQHNAGRHRIQHSGGAAG